MYVYTRTTMMVLINDTKQQLGIYKCVCTPTHLHIHKYIREAVALADLSGSWVYILYI